MLHNDENIQVILSLKELLNVSSDWMDVKGKGNMYNGVEGCVSVIQDYAANGSLYNLT